MQDARANTRQDRRSTLIEWADHTWNPFVGCSIHSDGCKNCYAMNLAPHLAAMGTRVYEGLTKEVNGKTVWTGIIRRHTDSAVEKPLRLKKPAIIFVNSMSDYFHQNIEFELQKEAMDIMTRCPQHQFQVLTKRPENIQKFLTRYGKIPENVWLGCTVANQKAVESVEHLRRLQLPNIKFISMEPLIGLIKLDLSGIDWVITGGETGGQPERYLQLEWVRAIRDQCLQANVPHFFKQWGKWTINPIYTEAELRGDPKPYQLAKAADPHGKGGSMLDGEYYKGMPREFQISAWQLRR